MKNITTEWSYHVSCWKEDRTEFQKSWVLFFCLCLTLLYSEDNDDNFLSKRKKKKDMHKALILFHFTFPDSTSIDFDHKRKKQKHSNSCWYILYVSLDWYFQWTENSIYGNKIVFKEAFIWKIAQDTSIWTALKHDGDIYYHVQSSSLCRKLYFT